MKKIALAGTLLLCCAVFSSRAQCDKNILLTSSATEYLDTSGKVIKTMDEKSRIEIRGKSITIAATGNPTMTGTFTKPACAWVRAFNTGKSVYHARFEEQGSQAKDVTVTIEGENGIVYLYFVVKDKPGRVIRVKADTFELLK